jgi:hypothetical protein
MRHPPRWSGSSALRAVAPAILVAMMPFSPARAADPRKLYPALAERRATLDSLALVVDAIETEDVIGTVDAVLVQESREYADLALKSFGAALARRKYQVMRSDVLTLGALADPARRFRCPDKTIPPHADASGFYVGASADTSERFAPFYTDSTILGDDAARTGWHDLLAAMATRRSAPTDSDVIVPAAVELGRRLGCDALVVVSVQSHSQGSDKRVIAATLSGVVVAGSGEFVRGHDPIGAVIRLAIFDALDGRMLWSDARTTTTLSRTSLTFRAPEMVDALP